MVKVMDVGSGDGDEGGDDSETLAVRVIKFRTWKPKPRGVKINKYVSWKVTRKGGGDVI